MSGNRARLGVFGGTFDPPHVGHLVTAVNVRHELSLEVVLMVVANEPWQKVDDREVSPAADRLAMVEAAVEGVEGVVASAIEVDRGGPSYTADTLLELRAARPELELFVILGRDAAEGIETWERVSVVRELSTVVVVDRLGAGGRDLAEGFRWIRVEVPRMDVSSTDLRGRASDGRPMDFLVPPAVAACIDARGLYREARS